jgi:hypothetical protein
MKNVFFQMKRPNLDSIRLAPDDPLILEAQVQWNIRHEGREEEDEGESWAKCFKFHKKMREQLLRTFHVPVPSVTDMKLNLSHQSNVHPPEGHFNWVDGLLPREADVLGMHLSSYLLVCISKRCQYVLNVIDVNVTHYNRPGLVRICFFKPTPFQFIPTISKTWFCSPIQLLAAFFAA